MSCIRRLRFVCWHPASRPRQRSVDAAIEPLPPPPRSPPTRSPSGGRLAYAGAGSSGLMAMTDALELPGTYGIALDKVVVLLAGGAASLTDLAGGYEDDMELATQGCSRCRHRRGRLPDFASLPAARRPMRWPRPTKRGKRGARVIAMANNPGAMLVPRRRCRHPAADAAGSRSPARRAWAPATAQKIAFNMFSTLVGIHLGHVLRRPHGQSAGRQCQAARPRRPHRLRHCRHRRGRRPAADLTTSSGSVKIAILLACRGKGRGGGGSRA